MTLELRVESIHVQLTDEQNDFGIDSGHSHPSEECKTLKGCDVTTLHPLSLMFFSSFNYKK